MLPLGFNDLAGSPTIVLSPHQHQFDPISSRAAHSLYYHQPCKPIMPTRHWDHPVAMSKAAPLIGNKAKKRGREDEDEGCFSEQWFQAPKTPFPGPEKAAQDGATAGIKQFSDDQMELELKQWEKSSESPRAFTASEPTDGSLSPVKRQCLQTATSDTDDKNSEEPDSNSWEALLGPGWTAVKETGHEGDMFRQFTEIVRDRFDLPGRLHWIAKHHDEGLMLAHTCRGASYFDSTLSRYWLVALSLGFQKKCREVFAGKEAYKSPFPSRNASESDGELMGQTYMLDKPYFEKSFVEGAHGVDFMSLLDGGRSIRSQSPTPARRDIFPPSPPYSHPILDNSGDRPQEFLKRDCWHTAEAMEVD